jgi:hypothetical protein
MPGVGYIGAAADHGAVGVGEPGGSHQLRDGMVLQGREDLPSELLGVGSLMLAVPFQGLLVATAHRGRPLLSGMAAVGGVTARQGTAYRDGRARSRTPGTVGWETEQQGRQPRVMVDAVWFGCRFGWASSQWPPGYGLV